MNIFIFHIEMSQEVVGGIFFDNLRNNFEKDFNFVKDVGNTFLNTFTSIINLKINNCWSKKLKEDQLIKRGRYVEFNLLYDRGTAFGLKTKEILMQYLCLYLLLFHGSKIL